MTEESTRALYAARYWNVVKGDQLPPGLDILVADIAVLSGTRRAAEMLQDAVMADVDGHIGPATLEAARRCELMPLIEAVHHRRMSFLRSLDGWATFGKGWEARCRKVLEVALDVADTQRAPEPAAVAVKKLNLQSLGAIVSIIVASAPAMQAAYEQTSTATKALSGLWPMLPVCFGLAAAACVLLLRVRGADAVKNG